MRILTLILTCLAMLSVPTVQANAEDTGQQNGFAVKVRGLDVKVEFYSPSIVRVLKYNESSDFTKKKDFVVEMEPEQCDIVVSDSGNQIIAKSSELQVKMNKETGKIEFYSLDGKRLLAEKEYGTQIMPVQFVQRIRPQRPQPAKSGGVVPTQSAPGQDTPGMNYGRMRIVVEKTNEIKQSFILDEDEVIYGLGQHQAGKMNQRDQRLRLEQNNMEIAIPYFSSVKGYGVYWDTYSITTFDDTPMGTSFTSEAGEAIDYYFLYGKDGDGNVALFRELTGQAKLAPLWTFGFWQCKERYKSAEEVVDVVKKYRDLQVPLDAIVQDWKYWGEENYMWNALEFNNPAFKNNKQMFASLKDMNAKMMITVWPSVGDSTRIHKELKDMGALFPMQSSPREAKVYDIWNKDARNLFWSFMNKNLFEPGMSAWWLDGPEPEFYNTTPGDFNAPTGEGTLRNVRNTYPLFVSKGVYENQRSVTDQKRVYILTRSAFAGLQRYGAGSWSGDIRASWDVFKKQIPAGLNFSMCAIPYWNTDIGAWHPYGHVYNTANTDPGYQEIYCRWFQFATFNPMMRAHGTGSPREIYQFGERGYWAFDVQEQYINLRYSMLPYIYSTAWQTTKNGYSFLRHMSMEVPADKETYLLDDQFMFGQAFLVAPILEDGVGENRTVNRSLYLPDNSTWFDYWTNERHEGGQTVTKEAPIDIIPLYVKAGSIVPFTVEKVQYATEKPWNRLEIKVYPGADGKFVLYEDEFDNYNYEKGKYTEIPFTWDDAAKTLTIGERTGEYNGMIGKRTFVVKVAGENTQKNVRYTGKKTTIKF